MIRCDDRPPLLEGSFAQTRSGKKQNINDDNDDHERHPGYPPQLGRGSRFHPLVTPSGFTLRFHARSEPRLT